MYQGRWVSFLLALFVAFWLAVFASQLGYANQVPQVPKELQTCLPPSPTWLGQYQFDVAGKVENSALQATGARSMKKFYLLDVLSPWEENDVPWQTLIGVDTNGKCFGYLGQNAMNVTLTAFMPANLANEIVYQKFSHWLMHPQGKDWIKALLTIEEFEENSKVPTSPEPNWIAPEDAWALQKLGYPIPSQINLLKTLTPYQFDGSEAQSPSGLGDQ